MTNPRAGDADLPRHRKAGKSIRARSRRCGRCSATDRKRLFVEAGHLIVDLAKRYYKHDDSSVLPRSFASLRAFKNAMTLNIAEVGQLRKISRPCW